MESNADADPLIASRSERETLDDNNYQTVKAVPAIVVINSPKAHKSKGQLFSSSLLLLLLIVAELRPDSAHFTMF